MFTLLFHGKMAAVKKAVCMVCYQESCKCRHYFIVLPSHRSPGSMALLIYLNVRWWNQVKLDATFSGEFEFEVRSVRGSAVTSCCHTEERRHLRAAGVLSFYQGHSGSQNCFLSLSVAYTVAMATGKKRRSPHRRVQCLKSQLYKAAKVSTLNDFKTASIEQRW